MRLQAEYLRILLLIRSSDIETNPGPKKTVLPEVFSLEYNGLAAHHLIKLPLMEVYIATNNFDIMCFYETFLESSIANGGKRINIAGYSLIRADHPSNTKKRGVLFIIKISYL